MNKKVLIVEDQFVEANDLQLMLRRAGYEVCGIARSVESAQEIIEKEHPGLVLLDIFLKGKSTGIDLAKELKRDNIAFIYLSANSNEAILAKVKTTEPYGFIVKPFREKDLLVTLEIAQYRHEHSRETQYRREAEVIQDLNEIIHADIDWNEKLLRTIKIIQQELPFDYLAFDFDDTVKTQNKFTSYLRIGFNEYQMIGINELSMISGIAKPDLIRTITSAGKKTNPGFFNKIEFEKITFMFPFNNIVQETFQMRSLLSFPLFFENERISNLCFYSRRPDVYTPEHISLLYRLQQTLLNVFKEKDIEKAVSETKAIVDKSSMPAAPIFEGMVGSSHLLLNVFDLMKQVAPFDTAVLVLGESGTGKEKIAECIHELSPRNDKPFVKLNCATLPATLIESELFGHEKGSFTGAISKRKGKFEQANGGTIFLDEIGEIPVDLQAKLLRVLQEKEIEPIGGKSPVKIDVRVMAATNRNLEKEVGEGRFRLDLYYRLNVFPISLPPLRERLEDIPVLSQHFINIYNRKCEKKITGISDKVLNNMLAYNWPGNIRELENLIERSVLLSKTEIIDEIMLPIGQPTSIFQFSNDARTKTIYENERDHIISVLKKCNGKIWGEGGAAEILNLPPTTLKSKMKKLGIQKDNNN